ncbi:cell wall-binding repeat-containing protein, partial [Schumannella luteola]
MITPSICGGAFSGLGSIGDYGDGGAVIIPENANVLVPGLSHEIGHNLGLGHSNIDWCPTSAGRVTPSGCDTYEYADIYDVMGYGWSDEPAPALSMPRRYELGFLGGSEVPTVTRTSGIATQSTVALNAVTAGSGVRGVRVVDPYDPSAVYYVEYRNGTGGDSGAFYTSSYFNSASYPDASHTISAGTGVLVSRLVLDGGAYELQAFAMPTGSTRRELALDAGEAFHTADQGVHVEVVSATGATAQVRITAGAWYATATAPTVDRIAGADRYEVAVAISQATFATTVDTVFLATGMNFPDAL